MAFRLHNVQMPDDLCGVCCVPRMRPCAPREIGLPHVGARSGKARCLHVQTTPCCVSILETSNLLLLKTYMLALWRIRR
jgi:hypothetical protein